MKVLFLKLIKIFLKYFYFCLIYNIIYLLILWDNVKSSMKNYEKVQWKSNTGKKTIIALANYLKNDRKNIAKAKRMGKINLLSVDVLKYIFDSIQLTLAILLAYEVAFELLQF